MDDAFGTNQLGRLEGLRVRREHALSDAVVVPEIDEQELPMIAFSVHPAREPNLLTDMLGAQLIVGMSSVLVRLRRGHAVL